MSNLSKRLDRLEANAPPACPDAWHKTPYIDWPPDYETLVGQYASQIPVQPPRCPTCNSEPSVVIEVRYTTDWPAA